MIFKQKRILNRLRKAHVLLKECIDHNMDILNIERPDLLYSARRHLAEGKRLSDSMKEIIDNKIKELENK